MTRICGKVIISGEHSVVYGKLALAASVGVGVTATVVENGGSEKNEIIRKAIGVAGGSGDLQVKIVSEIPIGSGMGSSAAVAAAVITSVKEYLGKKITNKDELFELVMECEKVAHGNPSGIDAATVVYGGLIGFTKGQPIERLEIPRPLKILLVDSGKPSETTKEMVELVAKTPNRDVLTEKIGEITEQLKEQMLLGNNVAELLDSNGSLLEELGVVGDRAKNISKVLRGLRASVKVTGAGGVRGGSGMLLVLHDNLKLIKNLLDKKSMNYFETTVGGK